jgi:polysaccharide export outer membrane protein
MNLLLPRYRKQRSRNWRTHTARGGLRSFSLLAVCAIFWTGALGYPPAARAQNDASPSGSQPAVVPAPAVPDRAAPEAQSLPETPNAKVDAPKVDAPKAVAEKNAPAGAKATTPSVGGKSYIIGPNDVLSVKVWNQAQISAIYDVHLDGMISIPLVGEIKAEGLTAIQLKQAITERLGEVLTEPNVDVSVLKINSKHYRVYGGVMRGGEFVLAERTTIMDALALTNFKDGFAKTNKIELRRGKEKFLFNYKDFIKGRNMDKNINRELQDGDEIIVPE